MGGREEGCVSVRVFVGVTRWRDREGLGRVVKAVDGVCLFRGFFLPSRGGEAGSEDGVGRLRFWAEEGLKVAGLRDLVVPTFVWLEIDLSGRWWL